MKTHLSLMNAVLACALFFAISCGSTDDLPIIGNKKKSELSNADAQASSKFADAVTPDQEYYNELLLTEFNNLKQTGYELLQGKRQKPILYINFSGATVEKGFAKDDSFLLCESSSTIPGSDFNDEQKTEIVNKVKEYFAATKATLEITTQKPTSGTYTTVHVGGSYKDLGCEKEILGIAPLDKGNANPSDVLFVFTAPHHNVKMTAVSIAHEAAHSFGLEHVDNEADLMFTNYSEKMTSFATGTVIGTSRKQNGPELLRAYLGSSEPVSTAKTSIDNMPNVPTNLSSLPGLKEIAAIAKLIADYKDGKTLDISALITYLEALKPAGFGKLHNLPGLDKIITVLVLASVATQDQQSSSGTNDQNQSNNAGGILKNVLNSALDPNSLLNKGIKIVSSLAGFGAIGEVISIFGDLFGKKDPNPADQNTNDRQNNTNDSSPAATLPNFADLLGLTQINNVGDLIRYLKSHAQIINGNYMGDIQQALLSMLKVAYAQAYTNGSYEDAK